MKARLRAFAKALMAGAVIVLAGSAATALAQNNTLTVATTAGVTTFDPLYTLSTEVGYMANVYQGLTYAQSENGTTKILPQLATKWTHSPDGLTWTFTIRQGVHFHDGSVMTAQSVANSINQTIKTNQGAAYIWAPVKSVTATDPDTVTIQLKYAAPLDHIVSSEYGAWIVGPDGLKQPQSWFNAGHDDGTGPYTISGYQRGAEIDLKAFPDYWGGWSGSHYTTIVNQIVSQSSVQQQMVASGQADIATAITVQALTAVKANPNLVVDANPSFYWYNAFFNIKKAPLNNVLVRKALAYAIPYQAIVKVATGGYGKQLDGPLPYGQYPHVAGLPQYHQDLQKAKALLAQAGYPNGGLHLTVTYASQNPEEQKFAPLMKEAFAKIGVDLTIKPILWQEQWALGKGDPQKAQDIFLLLDWPSYSDSTPDLKALYACETKTVWNLSYFCNKQFDSLLEAASKAEVTAPDEAQTLFAQLEDILYQQVPAAWLYQDASILVMNKSVGGYQANPAYPFVIFYYPLHPST